MKTPNDSGPISGEKIKERMIRICGCNGIYDCDCVSVANQARSELWHEYNTIKYKQHALNNEVVISGMASDDTFHATVQLNQHECLYFLKNREWNTSCWPGWPRAKPGQANGHWESLHSLIVALKEEGFQRIIIETLYVF